ncbi:MAG: ferrous iron transport protein A [Thermoanaerobacteraceae bacterium]|nr:ferrous iron transport protein A [Thermoanaerobacteraceae bacterium]
MEEKVISLYRLPIGKLGMVKKLTAKGSIRRRMQDLGLVENTLVEALRKSPSGDPIAYQIRGAVIALRFEEATKILVQVC